MDIVGASSPKDIFGFLTYLKSIIGAEVIAAYFKWDSTHISGSKEIKVETHKAEKDSIFWLFVQPMRDYIFIRFPLNGNGCEEIIGTVKDAVYSDPSYWRWVQNARSGTIVDGGSEPPNAKVDFVVVGYKPDAIIKHLSAS